MTGKTPRTQPYRSALLTVSGNEITDAVRQANLQGDGLTYPDGTCGVWQAATNLAVNGNATTNTTGVTNLSATTTRVTTGTHKFGASHFETVTANASGVEGAFEAISGGAASTQYTISVWAWAASGSPTVRLSIYDDVSLNRYSSTATLTSTPQRISVTATTGVASTVWRTYIITNVQQAATFQWGGIQTETGAIASPYVETDGGTATRAAGRVQVPVAGIANSTQMWFAARTRMGWASTTTLGGPGILSWGDTTNDIRFVYDSSAADKFLLRRKFGAGATNVSATSVAFSAGGILTTIADWTATTLAASTNGLAFVSGADTNVPSLTTPIDLGTDPVIGAGRELDGDFFWWAMGLGTLSDFDAAVIGALPNIVRPEMFPASAGLTAYGNGGEFPAYWSRA